MVWVVQSSQKVEPQQEVSFPSAVPIKHEESAKPTQFRPSPKV